MLSSLIHLHERSIAKCKVRNAKCKVQDKWVREGSFLVLAFAIGAEKNGSLAKVHVSPRHNADLGLLVLRVRPRRESLAFRAGRHRPSRPRRGCWERAS